MREFSTPRPTPPREFPTWAVSDQIAEPRGILVSTIIDRCDRRHNVADLPVKFVAHRSMAGSITTEDRLVGLEGQREERMARG